MKSHWLVCLSVLLTACGVNSASSTATALIDASEDASSLLQQITGGIARDADLVKKSAAAQTKQFDTISAYVGHDTLSINARDTALSLKQSYGSMSALLKLKGIAENSVSLNEVKNYLAARKLSSASQLGIFTDLSDDERLKAFAGAEKASLFVQQLKGVKSSALVDQQFVDASDPDQAHIWIVMQGPRHDGPGGTAVGRNDVKLGQKNFGRPAADSATYDRGMVACEQAAKKFTGTLGNKPECVIH